MNLKGTKNEKEKIKNLEVQVNYFTQKLLNLLKTFNLM